ncbi:MAG: TRAP transporter small permease [Betaproteobacteria bacterium]
MSDPSPGPAWVQVTTRRIDALVGGIGATLTAVSVALLASYFVVVLLQVFFRYVLNASLFWAEELVRGLMVWGVMIGSALVAASRGHIRVEVLELMLPPAGRRVVVWISDALTISFSLILLAASIQLMDRSWTQQSPILEIPKWSVYMAIAAGAGLEALITLLTWNRASNNQQQADPTI